MTVKNLKKIAPVVAFVLASVCGFSQNGESFFQMLNYSAYVGGTCPIGTYGKTNITNAGSGVDYINNNWVLADQGGMKASAKLGCNVGLKATLPFDKVGIKFGNNNAMPLANLGKVGKIISTARFSFIGTLDFFYNGVHSIAESNLFPAMVSHHVHYLSDVNMQEHSNDITLEFNPAYQLFYINIPLMVGVNATYDYGTDWSFWAETEIGVDVRKISDIKEFSYEARLNDINVLGENHVKTFSTTEGTIHFNWNAAFACQVGIGATWQKRYSIGLHYYFLGKSKITGTKDYVFTDPEQYGNYPIDLNYQTTQETSTGFQIGSKLSQNLLVLRLGYNF